MQNIDYSFKPTIDPASIARLQQQKAMAEAEAKERERAQKLQQIQQIVQSGSQIVSSMVEHSKNKQRQEFVKNLAESMAASVQPAPLSLGFQPQSSIRPQGMGQVSAGPDLMKQDMIRNAVMVNPGPFTVQAAKNFFDSESAVADPYVLERMKQAGQERLLDKKIAAEKEMNAVPKQDKAMAREVAKAKAESASLRAITDTTVRDMTFLKKLNENSLEGYLGSAEYKARSATGATNNEEFKNTARVMSGLKAQAAKMLKSTFAGSISNEERQFLVDLAGANVSLSKFEREVAMDRLMQMVQDKQEQADGKLSDLTDAPIKSPKAGKPSLDDIFGGGL